MVRRAAVAGLLLAWACGAADEPARKVERLRSGYSAKLTGWVVDQMPLAGAETPSAMIDSAAGGTLAGGDLVAAPPVVSDVHLDLEIHHDSPEQLRGLTVEVAHADGIGKEKGHYRIWLDTAAVAPGAPAKLTYTLEEVPHVAGDVFTAEVRKRIPKSEWPLYKEFPAVQ